MQTLTAGSFLNLESAEKVEALKFTARQLAEHTASVVRENLNAQSLENLANSLWEKAEYVARETERRRLHQIFVENFSERFRELKPDASVTETSVLEVSPADSTVENTNLEQQSLVPKIIENGGSECAMEENVSPTDSTKENTPAVTSATGEKDEFLGFVKSDEPFGEEASITEPSATTLREESEQSTVQVSTESVADKAESAAETPHAAKPEATVSAVTTAVAKVDTTATNAVKNSPHAPAADVKEPFEFGKCTVNLNLVLLPFSTDGNVRKVIVGATSHNLPPEIDFLEITEGEDLNQIAGLVRDKLARFKQTLPVKYIEQLRASKNKSAKKPATTKATTTAVPSQPAINKATAKKESGEQKAQITNSIETEKPQHEATVEMGNSAASTTAPTPTVQQSVAANNVQGSLF